MEQRFDAKVVLITGAGAGIGKAYCERFAAEGAKVVAADIDHARAQAVADAIGGGAIAVELDASSAEGNRAAVEAAIATFGQLDVFVGNAGVFDGFMTLPQSNGSGALEELFDKLFAVNVKGYLLGAHAAYPELLKTGGNIVYTASTAGSQTNQGGIVYTMSKHAVVGLVRELAYELAPKIRVNAVAPGGTFTDLRNAVKLGQEFGDERSLFDAPGIDEFIESSTPLRRVNDVSDHAAVAAFLASSDAAGLTGAVLPSDGGYAIRGAAAAAGGDEL